VVELGGFAHSERGCVALARYASGQGVYWQASLHTCCPRAGLSTQYNTPSPTHGPVPLLFFFPRARSHLRGVLRPFTLTSWSRSFHHHSLQTELCIRNMSEPRILFDDTIQPVTSQSGGVYTLRSREATGVGSIRVSSQTRQRKEADLEAETSNVEERDIKTKQVCLTPAPLVQPLY